MKIKTAGVMILLVTVACGKIEEGKNFISYSSNETVIQGNDKMSGEVTLLSGKASIQGEVRSFQNKGRFSSTVHVLSSEKGNILIDPGHYSEELSRYAESIGGLDAILITHGHWDNIYSLDEAAAANPNAKIYIHELDYNFLFLVHADLPQVSFFTRKNVQIRSYPGFPEKALLPAAGSYVRLSSFPSIPYYTNG